MQTLKRKTVLNELEEMKKKRKRLQNDQTALEKSADQLAEKTRKMELVVQSNSLRKTSKAKGHKIIALNQRIQSKVEELKK